MSAHILILDPDAAHRRQLGDVLVGMGHATVEAGQDAPDLVIIDWPRPHGQETLRAIRDRHPVPVILCMDADDMPTLPDGMAAGASDYVLKPIALPVLRARIAKHLTKYAGDD